MRSLEAVSGELALAVPLMDPPAGLGRRLFERGGEAGAPKEAHPKGILLDKAGLLIARSPDLPWQPQGSPGVSIKVLFTDPERDYITALGRMEPGTEYPRHRHDDVEELYVLEGDLVGEGHVMRRGTTAGPSRTASTARRVARPAACSS
ncbi:MAG: hypothetical protein DMF82_18550 [Acidobacteria bacterium]|nr:MAG: hypothetical protein DMF82_18550 [Acidobacteriota bacterium]